MDNCPNNIANNYSTGNKSYWKALNLNKANKIYNKLMNGKRYEDDPRARSSSVTSDQT